MALDRCLPGLERSGALDAGRSAEARALYERNYKFFLRSHAPEAAAALASQKTVEGMRAAVAHKTRNLIRQAEKQGAIAKALTPVEGGPWLVDAAKQIFDRIDVTADGLRGRAHSMIEGLLFQHRANVVGEIRAKAELADIRREVMRPGSTGNANAVELAGALTKALDYLRARYNEAGGQIGRIDGWLPQTHDSRVIRDAGFDAWRGFISPLLDRGKIIDYRTGEPFADEAFDQFLRDAFETLRTDGWNKATPGATGGKMLANQRAEHRILHFAGPDEADAYEARFGNGNMFEAIVAHIQAMSRDIALLDELGPNPAATVRWMKDGLVKSAALDVAPGSKAIADAKRAATDVQQLYDEITGTNRVPYREDLALAFGTIRAVQTSAKLGSAMLSAITDLPISWRTMRFNGIAPTRYLTELMGMLNPLSAESRRDAVRFGLIADEWAHISAVTARYFAEDFGNETARRLASGVLRVSGLQGWTQGGRWAVGMATLGELTEQVGKSFDALDPNLRRAFEGNGISAADWDVIRAAPLDSRKGVPWLNPTRIGDQRVGDKLLAMLAAERDYAVPMPDLRTREAFNRFSGMRGTWGGEAKRSMILFRQFSFAVVRMHGTRAMKLGLAAGGLYAANLFIGMTMFGAISLQMKEIAKGKDPRPMFDEDGVPDPEFWAAAALQGGGAGIFGDFLASTENRFGGGFASTLAGPMAQTVQNVGDLTAGNVFKAARGDKTDAGADLMRVIRQETPGSSLWYSRLAFDRMIADQLQEEIDPNYRQSWRRLERNAKERGQDFYWEPGETSPDRAPDVENIGGAQ